MAILWAQTQMWTKSIKKCHFYKLYSLQLRKKNKKNLKKHLQLSILVMISSFLGFRKKKFFLGGGGQIATRPSQAHDMDHFDTFDITLTSVKRGYSIGNSEYFGHF